MDIERRPPETGDAFAPHPNVITRQVDGEFLLVHLESTRFVILNPAGERIWNMLGHGLSHGELLDRCVDRFSDPPDSAREDMAKFLAELESLDLVVRTPGGEQAAEVESQDGESRETPARPDAKALQDEERAPWSAPVVLLEEAMQVLSLVCNSGHTGGARCRSSRPACIRLRT